MIDKVKIVGHFITSKCENGIVANLDHLTVIRKKGATNCVRSEKQNIFEAGVKRATRQEQ